MKLVEMTSLLEKEVITPRLGGELICYRFMENHFTVQKMVQVGQFLSSPESGSIFLTDNHFSVRKMV
jgi:hypothetical protein